MHTQIIVIKYFKQFLTKVQITNKSNRLVVKVEQKHKKWTKTAKIGAHKVPACSDLGKWLKITIAAIVQETRGRKEIAIVNAEGCSI